MEYFIHNATILLIYLIIGLAFAIPVGYTGLVHFGHIGLVAIGAYTAAIATTEGVSFWIALALAVFISGIAGLLIAIPARHIKGDYFTLMTLGFLFVVNAVLLNWISFTRGPFGITGIHRPPGFDSPLGFLALTAIFLIVTGTFVYRLVSSPFGRALEAVRDDELVAESLGKPTAKLKVISLVTSAALAGLGGGLLAHFVQFINPQTFWLDFVVLILAGVVMGGLTSFSGTFLGMTLLIVILESIRFLPVPPTLLGSLRLMIFSGLLLLVVIFRPKGLIGRAQLE